MAKQSRWTRWVIEASADPSVPLPWAMRAPPAPTGKQG